MVLLALDGRKMVGHKVNSELNNVPHDFKYHAEIRYETERGFSFTNAMGNSEQEIVNDIKLRLNQYKDREPYLDVVIYKPNQLNKYVTRKIRKLLGDIKDVA